MTTLTISAACLFDDAGRLLLVRKRNTLGFMLPGGKAEPGEDAITALIRELKEELNLSLPVQALHHSVSSVLRRPMSQIPGSTQASSWPAYPTPLAPPPNWKNCAGSHPATHRQRPWRRCCASMYCHCSGRPLTDLKPS